MSNYNGTKINIGIEHPSRQIDDFPVKWHENYSLDLSNIKTISKSEIQKILADHEELGSIIQKHPDEVAEIINDVRLGFYENARVKAKSIGITEENFQKKSGGVAWWLLAAIVVGVMLYASEAQ